MAYRLSAYFSKDQAALIGLFGTDFISDTDNHTGSWIMFIPKETTVFTTLTQPDREGDSPLTPESHAAGIPIYGYTTVIKLESGAGWAIKAPDTPPMG